MCSPWYAKAQPLFPHQTIHLSLLLPYTDFLSFQHRQLQLVTTFLNKFY